VWNYWHVPGLYTYLRTSPEEVLPRALIERFLSKLRAVSLFRYGLGHIAWPYLSLYVAGCRQGLHNDSRNGRLGYVYSLTRWDERKFLGGETLIFKGQDYFRSPAISEANAGLGLYELIPARFNRLLLIDDCLLHAVPRIEGSMAPQEGRVVPHGHVSEGPVAVTGSIGQEDAAAAVERARPPLDALVEHAGAGLAGLVTVRLTLDREGGVVKDEVLFDRLLPTRAGHASPEAAIAAIRTRLRALDFPAAGGSSLVTIPMPFGARLR
jgi:hypothetical protein